MTTTVSSETLLNSPLHASLNPRTWRWRDHRICYCVSGQGKPVVLIHGFGACIGHWHKNIPALAAGGYQVYALDLLGFGASDKPPIDYTLDLWQDLLKEFWQVQVRRPAVFVGNSIGALLALMMVADYPELAVGGILLNCAGGLNHQSDDIHPIFQTIMKTFTQVVNSDRWGPLLFNQIRRKSQIRRTLRQVYDNSQAVTDELVEMLYEPACDPGAQKVFAAILRAPAGPKPTDLLPRIQRPLQVLWGESDPWAPIATGRRMFSIPQGAESTESTESTELSGTSFPLQFVPIPNTGHCPHDECPEVVNPLILDWLAQHHHNGASGSRAPWSFGAQVLSRLFPFAQAKSFSRYS